MAKEGCAYVGPIDEDGRICFFDVAEPEVMVASIEHILGVHEEEDVLYLRLVLDPKFGDNTYGDQAVGWEESKKGEHKFKDLVGSDHGRILLKDEAGGVLLDFKIDYISEDASSPSGYRTLGVWGGDGKVFEGSEDAIVAAMTSLDRNLNERGYSEYTENSPATDLEYSPNPDAPDWEYRMIYEAWVRTDVFPTGTLHHACIESIHASPAKGGENTKEVFPMPCRPPDRGCFLEDGCITETTGGGSDSGDEDPCLRDPDIPCEPSGEIPPVP